MLQERRDSKINRLRDRGDPFSGSIIEVLRPDGLAATIMRIVDVIRADFTSSHTVST